MSFRTSTIILLSLVGAILIAVLAYVGVILKKEGNITVDDRRTAVVKEIQLLGNLETASFTLEKVIEAGTDEANAFREFFYGDRILLVAHGTVVAGFDLSRLTGKDVDIENGILRIRVGSPIILSSTLDSSRTTVYDRSVGVFNRSGNKDLEAEARKRAESSLLQNACDEGILTVAAQRGEELLEKVFGLAGFKEVIVESTPGQC